MGSQGSNISAEIANLRDSFFGTSNEDVLQSDTKNETGELDYLKEILKKSAKAREIFAKFKRTDPRILYNMAMERINKIENGQVKEEDLEKVEGEIALLLGAIEDLVLVRILEKTKDDDDAEMER